MSPAMPQPPAQCLLVITYPVAAEDDLVDWLLARPDAEQGFSTWRIGGRGRHVALLTAADQLRGYGQFGRAEIVTDADEARGLLEALHEALPGRGLVYWCLPVTTFGRIE